MNSVNWVFILPVKRFFCIKVKLFLKNFGYPYSSANIIKQEMLACGGDCAIPAGCVVCAEERVDVILLGTYKHYARLLEKLTQMPYFGMAGIKSELMAILDAPIPQTILSDGRTLNYDKMLVMGILNITPDSFYAGSRVPQLNR